MPLCQDGALLLLVMCIPYVHHMYTICIPYVYQVPLRQDGALLLLVMAGDTLGYVTKQYYAPSKHRVAAPPEGEHLCNLLPTTDYYYLLLTTYYLPLTIYPPEGELVTTDYLVLTTYYRLPTTDY